MDALNARQLFQFRTLINCAIILAVFVPLVAISAWMQGGYLFTVGLIAILYFLFFHVLQKRTVGFVCPHCRKHLSASTPWVCGFCKATNRDIDDHPFLGRCAPCGAEPKAYRCHHCSELIFLGNDPQTANFAYSLDNRPPAEPLPDQSAIQKNAREAMLHEIQMAELAFKLEDTKKQAELGKPKSPVEEIETSFSKFYARVMGSHEFAARQRAEIDVKYKEQPELKSRAHEAIDAWLRNRT
jgi:hypothetical protein